MFFPPKHTFTKTTTLRFLKDIYLHILICLQIMILNHALDTCMINFVSGFLLNQSEPPSWPFMLSRVRPYVCERVGEIRNDSRAFDAWKSYVKIIA